MARQKGLYIFILVISVLVTAGVIVLVKRASKEKPLISPAPEVVLPVQQENKLAMPDSMRTLKDSTHIFFIGDTRVTPANTYPSPREVNADGTCFFEVPAGPKPFIVKTKLLILSVTGKAAFLVMASSKEESAEIQVLSGAIIAKKAYPSQFDEPDTLRNNQMLMINRTIDLMEKEDLDTRDLQDWYKKAIIVR